MHEKETPAIIQEQQKTIETCLRDYCKAKEDLKELKKALKSTEKKAMQTNDILDLQDTIKALKLQMSDHKHDIQCELNDDDDYNALRELVLKTDERRAQLQAELSERLESSESKQMSFKFDVDGIVFQADVQTEKQLYINGKKI